MNDFHNRQTPKNFGGGSNSGSGGSSGKQKNDHANAPLSAELLDKIDLTSPSVELFDLIASKIAKEIGENSGREMNASTQLRRFYDEVLQWDQRIQQKPDEFEKFLPLIRMINAKVAYAQGRKLVDKKFSSLIENCLRKIVDKKSFDNFKTFFEAFLGFYKIYKTK